MKDQQQQQVMSSAGKKNADVDVCTVEGKKQPPQSQKTMSAGRRREVEVSVEGVRVVE